MNVTAPIQHKHVHILILHLYGRKGSSDAIE